jgi:hypothetical protein
MSKMSDLHADVMDAVEQGMSIKYLVATFGISFDLAEQLIEQRENLEVEKQYEFLSYADEVANDDAQYYGEN